jgi:hypothetical protein
MMDMASAHCHVVKRADVVVNGECDAASNGSGNEESQEGQEQPFAPGLHEVLLID